MNTPVLCTNNTRLIKDGSYLYLPSGWLDRAKYDGREIPVKWYRGLHIIRHTYIWYDGISIWRIGEDDTPIPFNTHVPPRGYHCQFFQNDPDTRLWHHTGSGSVVKADRVSIEELRFEAIFL